MQHVPSTEFIFEPIRDNDQNSLRVQEKNKMAAIGSGARIAAFDWNNWHRKRKLLVILMTVTNDEAVLVLLLGFYCLLVVCPIELDYP